jgi:hypothetical protein
MIRRAATYPRFSNRFDAWLPVQGVARLEEPGQSRAGGERRAAGGWPVAPTARPQASSLSSPWARPS